MSRKGEMEWNEDQLKILRSVADKGGSVGDAAKELGCSRCAAMGKAWRERIRFRSKKGLWSPKDRRKLRRMAAQRKGRAEMASALNRSHEAIGAQATLMGVSIARIYAPPLTESELQVIRDADNRMTCHQVMELLPKRSYAAIWSHAKRMGVTLLKQRAG